MSSLLTVLRRTRWRREASECAIGGYAVFLALPLFCLFFPGCHELSSFPPPVCSDVPSSALEPAKHGLTSLKPRAKINLHSFKLYLTGTLSQQQPTTKTPSRGPSLLPLLLCYFLAITRVVMLHHVLLPHVLPNTGLKATEPTVPG